MCKKMYIDLNIISIAKDEQREVRRLGHENEERERRPKARKLRFPRPRRK